MEKGGKNMIAQNNVVQGERKCVKCNKYKLLCLTKRGKIQNVNRNIYGFYTIA